MTTSSSSSCSCVLSTQAFDFKPRNPPPNSSLKFRNTRPLQVSCDYSRFEIRDLSYRPPGTQTNILSGVTLSLTERSFGLIFGRSGSGKSTLLQLIAGVSKPTSGSICIQRFHDDGSPNQSPILSSPERVGIVFQFPERYFLADNILDEVTFGWPRQKAGLPLKEHLASRLQRAITSVGLSGISLDKDPRSLSGGYKRRLALAIQLVQSPDLLVLDEPLAGLDWKARADVVKLLKNLKEKLTILVVSHDLKMPPRRDNTRNNGDNTNPHVMMDMNAFMGVVQQVVAQRMQNPGDNGQNREGQIMFDRFMKQRPNYFKEAKTPMDAEAWIDHMDKIFRVLGCSDVEKARFATYRLEGDAGVWWKSVVASHAAGYEDTLTWDAFRNQFNQRYFPASIREEYAREYQTITQKEDESVADFQVRFQRLAGYAKSVAGTEDDKIMKFKWALKSAIRNHIISNRYTSMDSLVDSARDQELHQADFYKQREVHNQKRKRDGESFGQRQNFQKNGESFGQRQNFQKNGGSFGGFRRNTQSFQQRNGDQGNEQNRSSNQAAGYQNGGKSTCEHCGKMHSGVCYWVTRSCFNCGKKGHTIQDCRLPLKKPRDQNDQNGKNGQKNTGRVFSITARDAANTSGRWHP